MFIPNLHYISQGATAEEHISNIRQACIAGMTLVQLRLKNMSEKELLKYAEQAREITHHFHARLIINDHYKIAKAAKADGVHLGKNDTCTKIARAFLASWQIVGGTANTLEDCHNLINKKVDYIGLGPFRFTKTKENISPILGLKGYTEIITALQTNTPVIAIGGITLNDVPRLIKTGVYGIAASGEITKDFNSISLFHQTLNSASAVEPIGKNDLKIYL